MDLLIIRHGLPERVVNTDGKAANPALAPDGLTQAEYLSDYLAGERIDAIYASPMTRAHQTATPLATRTGLAMELREGIAEWDRDSVSYIPIEELKAAKDGSWEAFLRGDISGPHDPAEFRSTVVDTMEQIISAHRGQRVAVVCHGGVINAYCAHILDLPVSVGFFRPHYTSINRIIAASSGERSIEALNETAHLRGKGLLN